MSEPPPIPPLPPAEHLLAGLDTVDWKSLHHAFGPAVDVAGLLRDLLSPEPARRKETLRTLYETVWHQGTVYEATAHVVPFVAALLAAPGVPDRPALVLLLHSIATGTSSLDVSEHSESMWRQRQTPAHAIQRERELAWVRAGVEAVRAHADLYLELLAGPDAELRLTVPVLLTELAHEERIVDALFAACVRETEPLPKACMILALHALHAHAQYAFRPGGGEPVLRQFRLWLRDPAQGALVKTCAAIALVSDATAEAREEALEVFFAEVAAAQAEFRGLPAFYMLDPEALGRRGYSHPEPRRRWFTENAYEPTGWLARALNSHEARSTFYRRILHHPSADVRAAVIHGATDFCRRVRAGPALLAPHLASLLADEDEEVRKRAMYAMPDLGQAARGALETLVHSEQPELRTPAAAALLKVAETEKKVRPRAVRLRQRPLSTLIHELSATGRGHVAIRMAAARELEALGDSASPALPALHQALVDSDYWTCFAAACTISRVESDLSVLSFFLQALEEFPVSPELFECLGEMGAGAAPAIPLLRAFLDSAERPYDNLSIWHDELQCAAAAKALQRITEAVARR